MKRASAVTLILLCLTVAWAEEDDTEVVEPQQAPPPAPSPSPPGKQPSIVVESASYKHLGADGSEWASGTAARGDELFSMIRLEASQALEVQFEATVAGTKPQQAMLQLASPDGVTAFAVAREKKGTFTASVTPALLQKQLTSLGGEWTATLLLGDPLAAAGVAWVLGRVDLGVGAPGKPKVLTALHQTIASPKPLIEHLFRPPAQHPPAVVSLAFTGLALAPLALALIALAAVGANLKGLPTGAAMLWVLLFHGGIAAMLGLYLVFWVSLNLAETLVLAALLGTFVAATGYKALSAVADLRLAAAAKKPAVAEAKKTN